MNRYVAVAVTCLFHATLKLQPPLEIHYKNELEQTTLELLWTKQHRCSKTSHFYRIVRMMVRICKQLELFGQTVEALFGVMRKYTDYSA